MKKASTSQKLASLSSDSSRLLWSWMLSHLDCEGRFYADPAIVKGHVVPKLKTHTEETVERDLQDLHDAGLIILYDVGGERYLQYTLFDENQPGLRKDREADSEFPAPPEEIRSKSGVGQEALGGLKHKDKYKFKDKDKPEEVRSEPDAVDVRLTQQLVDLMLKNNPESSIIKRLTPARQAEWFKQCRLLREADGKTPEEIERVIAFSQTDSFWKANILSMLKLREKWDQLWLKAQRGDPMSGVRDWLAQKERERKESGDAV